ncbi:hypothetical protein EDC04DRAFT_2683725 [Pisolithus marmoratus]|nr:hypothetical protein EDC04DRAFT_2683725 [Pisolithus marmoratus]
MLDRHSHSLLAPFEFLATFSSSHLLLALSVLLLALTTRRCSCKMVRALWFAGRTLHSQGRIIFALLWWFDLPANHNSDREVYGWFHLTASSYFSGLT